MVRCLGLNWFQVVLTQEVAPPLRCCLFQRSHIALSRQDSELAWRGGKRN